MKLFQKGLCLTMALLMLLTALVSCSKDDEEQGSEESTVAVNEWEIDFSDRDYGEYEFTVMRANTELQHAWTGHPNDIYVEEVSGDILGNAVYNRNQTLSEMLNITISIEEPKDGTTLVSDLRTSTLAGETTYDLVVQQMIKFPDLINGDLIRDMSELELDTSYPWWDSKAEEALNISGKQYAMISDVIYVDKLSTIGVFFNSTMADNIQLPNLYEMVDNGEWTLEKMEEFSKIATDSGEEIYGISCQNDFSYFVMHSANVRTVSKDANGNYSYRLPYQRPITVLQEAFTMMNEKYFFNRQLVGEKIMPIDDVVKMFGTQNLFLIRPLQTFYYMKEYYDDYGVLPMPKYDDANEGYYSSINHRSAVLMAVPLNNIENERTADILQAWGMISNKIVNPEFYDRILSSRMVNDPESVRMLDIIFKQRVYDVGLIFDFGKVESIVLISNKFALQKAPTTIASSVMGSKESISTTLENYIEKIKNS